MSKTRENITDAKVAFAQAIQKLVPSDRALREAYEGTLEGKLDFAVSLAQKHIELSLIELMLDDRAPPGLDEETLSALDRGDWACLEKNRDIVETAR